MSLRADGDAAVDVEGVAGDVVAGGVGGEEAHHARHLARLAQPAQRDHALHRLQHLRRELVGHVTAHEARADRVHRHLGEGWLHKQKLSLEKHFISRNTSMLKEQLPILLKEKKEVALLRIARQQQQQESSFGKAHIASLLFFVPPSGRRTP